MKRKLSLVVLLAAFCGFVMAGCDNNSNNPPPPGTNMPGTNAVPTPPPAK